MHSFHALYSKSKLARGIQRKGKEEEVKMERKKVKKRKEKERKREMHPTFSCQNYA